MATENSITRRWLLKAIPVVGAVVAAPVALAEAVEPDEEKLIRLSCEIGEMLAREQGRAGFHVTIGASSLSIAAGAFERDEVIVEISPSRHAPRAGRVL